MSDENVATDAISNEPVNSEPVNSEPAEPEIVEVNADEARARQTGWVSKAEWIEQGKNEDDWISAKRYNSTGDLISQIKGLQSQVQNFDQRIANNNAIWTAKLENERSELMAKRDQAIEDADKTQVKALDEQIQKVDMASAQIQLDSNQVQAQPPAQPDPNVQLENEYFAKLPRGQQPFAAQVGQQYAQTGLVGQALIDAVQNEITKEFPQVNMRRNGASKTDTGRTRASVDSLTLDSLGADDKRALSALKRTHPRYAKMSDSELLKVVKDSKL